MHRVWSLENAPPLIEKNAILISEPKGEKRYGKLFEENNAGNHSKSEEEGLEPPADRPGTGDKPSDGEKIRRRRFSG